MHLSGRREAPTQKKRKEKKKPRRQWGLGRGGEVVARAVEPNNSCSNARAQARYSRDRTVRFVGQLRHRKVPANACRPRTLARQIATVSGSFPSLFGRVFFSRKYATREGRSVL